MNWKAGSLWQGVRLFIIPLIGGPKDFNPGETFLGRYFLFISLGKVSLLNSGWLRQVAGDLNFVPCF
ncbi:hypothetical protein B8W99_23890 [Peribacillus simplex]|nr:hypothetical protein B8W99_23890 [Peribacillus simplex]